LNYNHFYTTGVLDATFQTVFIVFAYRNQQYLLIYCWTDDCLQTFICKHWVWEVGVIADLMLSEMNDCELQW